VPFGEAASYHYRDPGWLTPEQIAGLEAHDRPEKPEPAGGKAPDAGFRERFARFCELRDSGSYVWEAALEIGVHAKTAAKYERLRKRGGLHGNEAT
jgi:hypothetical protein